MEENKITNEEEIMANVDEADVEAAVEDAAVEPAAEEAAEDAVLESAAEEEEAAEEEPAEDAAEAVEEAAEELKSKASEIVAKIKELVKEGNVTFIRIRKNDTVVLNLPMTVGIIGTVLGLAAAPWAIIIATITTVGLKCTVEVEKKDGTIVLIHGKDNQDE